MNFVQPIRDKKILANIRSYLKRKNYRDYILFITGIYTGFRIADILSLKVGDLRDKTYITIKEKKTDKPRTVKVKELLKKELEIYLADKDIEEYVFKSRQGKNKPITRERAYGILQDVAKEFGLDSIGCHSMRKTFGYHIYDNTKDIVLLQKAFNHSKPEITLGYIGLTNEELDSAVDNSDY